MPRTRSLVPKVRRSELRKIYDQDLPALPTHQHAKCECLPTVAYIRVSKVGKRTNIKSPEIQLSEIVRNANQRGLRIVKIVYDINVSGQNFDREALDEVLEDLKNGVYRHISLWKWSRWGRVLLGSLQMLAQVEDLGGEVESATEPFDKNTVWGEFNRDQALLQAAFQGKVIGASWKDAQKNRIEHQLPHNGRKRFGYVYNTEDERNRFYEVHPEEGPALAACYQKYLSGVSIRKIAAELNEAGFRTEFGNLFTIAAMSKLMETGFAAGLIRGRSEEMKRLMKRKPANSLASYDQWHAGKQESLISIGEWEQFKAKRLAAGGRPPRLNSPKFELSGLVFCKECARRMQAKTGRWVCTWQMTLHPETPVSVYNTEALSVVKDWLTKVSSPEHVEQEARRVFDRQASIEPQIAALRNQIKEIDAQSRNLLMLFRAAGGSEDAANRVMAELADLEGEKKQLVEKVESLTVEPQRRDYRAFGDIVKRWDEFEPEIHNQALSTAIGMVVVSSRPRSRARIDRDVVEVVEVLDVPAWSDWFEERRQRSA